MMNLRSGGSPRLLVAVLILLVPVVAAARTLTVSAGDKSGITGALAGAKAGDVILIGCGVYPETGLIIPEGVTLSGVSADASCVRIESNGGAPVISCENVGGKTRIENLTITAAPGGITVPVARGAGLNLMNASPAVTNVVVSGFEADYGGGVYCGDFSWPLFTDCRFEGNSARAVGGAVACTGQSSPSFIRCLFADNTAGTTGGAVNAALGSAPSLVNCTIARGGGAIGSGVSSWDSPGLVLDHVIIVDGAQGRAWDGDAASAPGPVFTDIYGNEGGDWVGALAPLATIDDNLSADPQFCGTADPGNPFTLNDASPCAPGAISGPGMIGAFDVNCSFISGTGDESRALPVASRLRANYPNPFNPRTTIEFDLKESVDVELAVFDVAGRMVKRLVSGPMGAGTHQTTWAGRDGRGRQVSAGVYFFRLRAGDVQDTRMMTLIK